MVLLATYYLPLQRPITWRLVLTKVSNKGTVKCFIIEFRNLITEIFPGHSHAMSRNSYIWFSISAMISRTRCTFPSKTASFAIDDAGLPKKKGIKEKVKTKNAPSKLQVYIHYQACYWFFELLLSITVRLEFTYILYSIYFMKTEHDHNEN